MSDDAYRDERLIAIQEDVHEIRGTVRDFHNRLDKTDQKIGVLERDIITVKAEQAAAEKIMTAEHVRLHQKVDDFNATLVQHVDQEERDRRKLSGLAWSTLLAVLGAIGTFGLQHLLNGSH